MDDFLNDPLAQELLRDAIPARLAYTGLEGFPRVIPIGILWNGAHLIVCTATSAPQVRALRELLSHCCCPTAGVSWRRPKAAQACMRRSGGHVQPSSARYMARLAAVA